MSLSPGSQLGPYEIVAPLGAGGMGEVYRARDSRLGREVAVKVLPASFLADADRLHRFQQEARTVGQLNHPNVLSIYDVGEHAGGPYLVTELLQGETLRERLHVGAVPLRKAVEWGGQMARGLAAAHTHGIVHRDLKPENIFLTREGQIKILDFGLAKLTQPEPSQAVEGEAPTLPSMTGSGMVLGTVGYMSPEQVRGRPADARSDIFSFGTVLYEMLTGRRAFHGETHAETMTAIIREEPPEFAAELHVPSSVERMVRRCLEKDPEERFQSARDLGFALDALSTVSVAVAPVPATAARRRRLLLPLALASALMLVFAALLAWRVGGRSAPQPSFHQLTFKRGPIYAARFAPDGRNIIYAAAWDGGQSQIYSTSPDSPESRPLGYQNTGLFAVSRAGELALALGCQPFFVADCGGTLARAPLSGGAPRPILGDVHAADWDLQGTGFAVVRVVGENRIEFPAGTLLYKSPSGWLNSVRISPQGDAVAFIEHPGFGDNGLVALLDGKGSKKTLAGPWVSVEGLAWSPDGKEVWFAASKAEAWANELHAVTREGKERLILRLPGITKLHDVFPDGRVLISKEVWRSSLAFRGPAPAPARDLSWFDSPISPALSDDGSLVAFTEAGAAGGTEVVAYFRKTDGSPAVRLGPGYAQALSSDGKLVLAVAGAGDQLLVYATGVGETVRIERGGIQHYHLAGWSPDSKRLTFLGNDGRSWRVYAQDLAGGPPRPVTPEVSVVLKRFDGPLLSPDAKFVWARDSEHKIWLYPLNGGPRRPVPGIGPDEEWLGWAADSKSAFIRRLNEVPVRIFRLDLATGQKQLIRELLPDDPAGVHAIEFLRITPDAKFLAYSYNRALSELYLVEGLK